MTASLSRTAITSMLTFKTWSVSGYNQVTGVSSKIIFSFSAEHINHIRKVVGVDHIGIGADFNGVSK